MNDHDEIIKQLHELADWIEKNNGLQCMSVPRKAAYLIAALQEGFATIDRTTSEKNIITSPEKNMPSNRFNDGKCSPDGHFWAGSMSLNETDASGYLYSIDATHQIHQHEKELTISNGLCWSLDKKYFYFIDTPTLQVVRYNYIDGNILHKTSIIKIDAVKDGYPDGMTMQDYVDWLFLFKDNPELLNLEHYINYDKLINNVEIKYEKDRTPPPSKKLTPLNSENYFTQMYSEPPTMVQSDFRRVEGEVRVSTNQGSITNGLLPYNFEKYGDFKQNFDVLGQNGKIYNEKMADKTDPYFLGAMVGPNWNVSKKNLG